MSGRPLHEQVRLFWWKWRYYERNERVWRKARLRLHMLRGDFYVRFPTVGNLLEALDEGRAQIEPWVLIESGCWFALYPETATARIGEGSILNLGCMVAATDRIDVGRHCMFANNCFLTDADHRFDDPNLPGEMITTVTLKKVSVGTEVNVVQEGVPDAIPTEMCYLGWQESLAQLAKLVEPEIPD